MRPRMGTDDSSGVPRTAKGSMVLGASGERFIEGGANSGVRRSCAGGARGVQTELEALHWSEITHKTACVGAGQGGGKAVLPNHRSGHSLGGGERPEGPAGGRGVGGRRRMLCRVVETDDCVCVIGAFDRVRRALKAVPGRLQEGFLAGPDLEEELRSTGWRKVPPSLSFRLGEHALNESFHVGLALLRLYVDAHWVGAAERCDDHVLGVSNVEHEGRFIRLSAIQPGLSVQPLGDGDAPGRAVVSVSKDGADQGPASKVPVPVGVEPIPLCSTMLGLHGKGPQDRSGIFAQLG